MSSLHQGKFIYVYLPNKFGLSINQKNVENRYKYLNLNINDLGILQKDYKKDLITSLKKIKNLRAYDLSQYGNMGWFTDESHYNISGNNEIAALLEPIFIRALDLN